MIENIMKHAIRSLAKAVKQQRSIRLCRRAALTVVLSGLTNADLLPMESNYIADRVGGRSCQLLALYLTRKIAVSEWREHFLDLFRHVIINADSWNNKNAFSTSQFWLNKLFLTLEDYQQDIVLSGTVWLDEAYYPVINSQIDLKEDGSKYRGLSHNQICIGAATDNKNIVCFMEGVGKTSQRRSFQTFSNHIAPYSTLIHDMETAHKKLVSVLNLKNEEYLAKDLKGLKDRDNPLEPVNDLHNSLKKFPDVHSGFNRGRLQDYLNLFAFVRNPPFEPLEKLEKVVTLVFQNPKSLHYRDQFGLNEGF